MGIKFYCPNGHKLNVKSFLAGKKAICPKCNVRVIVPVESQTTGVATAADESAAPQYAGTPWDAASPYGPAGAQASVGAAAAASPQASAGEVGFHAPGGSVGSNFPTGMPLNSPAHGPAQDMIDPIDEAPNAVWYVRPPSGGQFGPAAGPTMRSWILEGRVSGNALVWRDGWSEWRSAAAVFPSLGGPAVSPSPYPSHGGAPTAGWQQPAAPMVPGREGMMPQTHGAPIGVQAGMPMGPAGIPMGQPGMPMNQLISALESPLAGYESPGVDDEMAARRNKRRKKETDLTLYVTAALVIMTVILVVVLVLVLVRQDNDEAAPEPPAKTSQSADEKPAAAESGEAPAPDKENAGK